MNAVLETRASRPVPTLLGGSGRARHLPVPCRTLPALLRPLPSWVNGCDSARSHCVAGA